MYFDNNGYGIYVVGMIVVIENGVGVLGVVLFFKMLVLKVLVGDGFGSYE